MSSFRRFAKRYNLDSTLYTGSFKKEASITFWLVDQEGKPVGDDEDYINMSNSNTYAFLQWLELSVPSTQANIFGMTMDIPDSGKFDPRMLKQAIELSLANNPEDEGQEERYYLNPEGGPQIIDMGRRPEYFTERAKQMLELCDKAIQNNAVIVYS